MSEELTFLDSKKDFVDLSGVALKGTAYRLAFHNDPLLTLQWVVRSQQTPQLAP